MSSAQEIVTTLLAANSQLQGAQAKAAAAADQAGIAQTQVAGALQGSSEQLTGLIARIQDQLDEIARTIPPVRQRVTETISQIRSLGN